MSHSDTFIFLNSICWVFLLFFLSYFFIIIYFLPIFFKKIRSRSIFGSSLRSKILRHIFLISNLSLYTLGSSNLIFFFKLKHFLFTTLSISFKKQQLLIFRAFFSKF